MPNGEREELGLCRHEVSKTKTKDTPKVEGGLKDKRLWLFFGFIATVLFVGMIGGAEFALKESSLPLIVLSSIFVLVMLFSVSYLQFSEWFIPLREPFKENKFQIKERAFVIHNGKTKQLKIDEIKESLHKKSSGLVENILMYGLKDGSSPQSGLLWVYEDRIFKSKDELIENMQKE